MLGRESFALLYYPCIIRALSVHYPCIIHALSMHYPALSMHYPCIIHALSMHYPCIIHVVSVSSIFSIFVPFRVLSVIRRVSSSVFLKCSPAVLLGPPEFHAFPCLGFPLTFGVGGMRRHSAKCDDQKSKSPLGSAE